MRHGWLLALVCLLTSCGLFSSKTKTVSPLAQTGHWEGRLQLKILNKKPEQFSATFMLEGTAEEGELTIYSPIGTTVALASWNPQGATLTEGSQKHSFTSMDSLTEKLTGASLPLPSLMAWLNNDGPAVSGWEIRAESPTSGRRLFARRLQPLPQLQLALILDPP